MTFEKTVKKIRHFFHIFNGSETQSFHRSMSWISGVESVIPMLCNFYLCSAVCEMKGGGGVEGGGGGG